MIPQWASSRCTPALLGGHASIDVVNTPNAVVVSPSNALAVFHSWRRGRRRMLTWAHQCRPFTGARPAATRPEGLEPPTF
ncbi:MAG: hypothetical protein ACRENH_10020, partial [Gemmatimonadaceae bacterium]